MLYTLWTVRMQRMFLMIKLIHIMHFDGKSSQEKRKHLKLQLQIDVIVHCVMQI